MDKIEDRLKLLRSHLGMTQRKISDILGVKASYYSDLENGHRTITGKFISKLQNHFPVSADWMYTGKGIMITLNSEQLLYPDIVPDNVPYLDNKGKLTNLIVSQFIDKDIEEQREKASLRLKQLRLNSIPFEFEIKKRLLNDLIHNHKKINNLHSNLNDLRIFESIIANLNYYYFNKIDSQFDSIDKFFENGKFNYEGYKAAFIKEMEKLDKISPALQKISEAIKAFYKDLEEFDTEDIINGYFGNTKQEKPIK